MSRSSRLAGARYARGGLLNSLARSAANNRSAYDSTENGFKRIHQLRYSRASDIGAIDEPRDLLRIPVQPFEVWHRPPRPWPHRIGSVPHRFRSRPPSAIAVTTRISSGRSASATDTVMVPKCGNDQESSLCPSGTSRAAPAAATLTFDPITAFPPPIAPRIGFPSIGWTQAPPCSISPATPTSQGLCP